MKPKLINVLKVYEPGNTPYNVQGIPQFLNEELARIARPLSVLISSWEPPVNVGLVEPTTPTTINTTPTVIGNYQDVHFSDFAADQDIQIDQVNGTIDINGDADDTYIAEIVGFFNLENISVPANQQMFLYTRASNSLGNTDYLMGSAFIGGTQMDFSSLGSVRMIEIPGDTVLSCYLQMSEQVATVAMLSGDFHVNITSASEGDLL